MAASGQVTETAILYMKDGLSLEDVSSDTVNSNLAARTFLQLTEVIKSQQGFVQQYWGHQVEDKTVFVWYIDWESFEYSAAFVQSEAHESFLVNLGQVFDLGKAPPLLMYTRFTSEARTSLEAPVTEVALFTIPDAALDKALSIIEATTIEGHPVLTVGKAWGGAIGSVFHTANASDAAPPGASIALHGVFGYAAVEDHVKWRQTPEHAEVIKASADDELTKLGLANAILPGGNIFVPDMSMFHVTFHKGS